jgi:putative oligomerization/nucleic acid binding protein
MVAAAIVSLVVAVIGFVVAMVLNAFVLDKYDAYGEVPIPGAGTVQLPAGEVSISFHTLTTGSGSGLPVPSLKLRIIPPDGVSEPVVTESPGGTTTVNNDARVRVWVAQVAEAGSYQVATDGDVNGYISPRLAFGHGSQYGWVVWLFVGLFVLGLVELMAALWWSARTAKRPRLAGPQEYAPAPPSYLPTDQGVRLEQLKTLAELRDSGALTEAEFEAEKRRILNS